MLFVPSFAATSYDEGDFHVIITDDGRKGIMYPLDKTVSEYYNIPSDFDFICENAFKDCTDLYMIQLPEGLKEIGSGAFEGCTGLGVVGIPTSVQTIGNNAFKNCESLANLAYYSGNSFYDSYLLSSITYIGNSAFEGCKCLWGISLPANLKEIGARAFYDCDSFTLLQIPDGVTSIGQDLFSNCDNLRLVLIPESVEFMNDQTFKKNKPTIVTAQNSAAHLFAVQNNWPVRLKEDYNLSVYNGIWKLEKVKSFGVDITKKALQEFQATEILLNDLSFTFTSLSIENGMLIDGTIDVGIWDSGKNGDITLYYYDGTSTFQGTLSYDNSCLTIEAKSLKNGINHKITFVRDPEISALERYVEPELSFIWDEYEPAISFDDVIVIDSAWPSDAIYDAVPYEAAPALYSEPLPELNGYWEVYKVEVDGMDVSEEALAYEKQGVTFADDHAILHGSDIVMDGSGITVTPVDYPASYTVRSIEHVQLTSNEPVPSTGKPLVMNFHAENGVLIVQEHDPASNTTTRLFYEKIDDASAQVNESTGVQPDSSQDTARMLTGCYGTYKNSTYILYESMMGWHEAKAFCEQQGGHLVTITSQAEQDFIEQFIYDYGTAESYWIGLHEDHNSYFKLENFDGYGYSVTSVPIDNTMRHGFICEIDTPSHSDTTPISPVLGEYVKFGTDHIWQIINIEDNIATLFYAGYIPGTFDASIHIQAHALSLMKYNTYGSASWEFSDVRQWLNSRDTVVDARDVKFDYSNLSQGMSGMGMSAIIEGENNSFAFADKPGFLSAENFSELEYFLIELVENTSLIPYTQRPSNVLIKAESFQGFKADMETVYSDDTSISKTIDRMYLLSGNEIKDYLLNNNLSPSFYANNQKSPAYWLRDSVFMTMIGYYDYYGTEILVVDNNDASSKQADFSAAIRPACNINLTFISKFSGKGTYEDPYTFEIDPSVLNRAYSIDLPIDDTENQVPIPETTDESIATEQNPELIAFESAFQHSANKADKSLALISAEASKQAYVSKCSCNYHSKQIKGNENDEKYPSDCIVTYLISLGFYPDSIVQEDYSSPPLHSVGVTFAHREIIDTNGELQTLYAIIIRGTDGINEWISNFDIGTTDAANGFDKATSRVLKNFIQYARKYPPVNGYFSQGDYLVWTTGHSRGAAVANLLAGKYLPKYVISDKVYAYTFATPNVDKNATLRKNIINFVIDGDIVPRVPFSRWGFDRYGLTIYYSEDELNGIKLNSGTAATMFSNALSDKVQTQGAYDELTKVILPAIKQKAEFEEVDLEFMIQALFYTIYLDGEQSMGGTLLDLFVQLKMNDEIEEFLNLFYPSLNADELFFTSDDLIKFFPLVLPTHDMETYLEWMKQ